MRIRKKLAFRLSSAVILAFLLSFAVEAGSSMTVKLSTEERIFLKKHPIIVFVSQTRYPPFEFVGERGEHTGMCIELARWMATELGFTAQFIDMPFQDAQKAVLSGRADVLTSFFYSPRRDEKFDFTHVMWQVPASIFVRKQRPDIRDIQDLTGKRIAMQKGDYAREFLQLHKIVFETVYTKNFAQATDLVASGKADALIGDEEIVLYHIFRDRLTDRIKKVGDPLYVGQNCMAVKEGQSVLAGILNKGIELAKENGTIDRITHKWLGTVYSKRKTFLSTHLTSLLIASGTILLLLFLGWCWNFWLRRTVRERTRELQESELKYRAIFEGAVEGIYQSSPQGSFISVNPACARILGYDSPEELLKDSSGNLSQLYINANRRDEFVNILLEKGKVREFESEIRRKDGRTAMVSEHARAVRDQEGRLLYFEGFIEDISLRKQAESKLQWELGVRRSLAQVAADLIAPQPDIQRTAALVLEKAKALTDSTHGYVSAIDPQSGDIQLYTLTEMALKQCHLDTQRFVFHSQSDGRYNALWGFALNTRRAFFTNSPQAHPSAKGLPTGHIPLKGFLSVPIIIDRRLAGQIALANPLKAYSKQDMHAVELLGELYALALQRQQRIQDQKKLQQKLQHIQKMESIAALSGGIAHDFNNILGALIGYTEMTLYDYKLDEQAHANLEQVLKAGQRAKNLVQQILTFSRQAEQQRKPLRVQQILKEVLALTRSTLPSTIEIQSRIDERCGPVMADAGQVHQVAMNLITNAFHAMQETGGVLEIELSEVVQRPENPDGLALPPGSYICLTIRDNGMGMNKSTLQRIFDPYFTTKDPGKGTGLGLAVVHGIVKSYGGDIRVYSEPGQGATFHVYLPRIRGVSEVTTPRKYEAMAKGNEQVLIVDDEKALVDLLEQMLRRLGYRVTKRNSSLEALQAFKDHPQRFDLVITDMTMPQMTGDRLACKLLQIRPDIPVIICTGFSTQVSEAKARSMGIRAFVMKPVVMHDLATTIRKVLDA